VVGVEFSTRGDEALAEAIDLALRHLGDVHAVHVAKPSELEGSAPAGGHLDGRHEAERPIEATARRIWHRVQHVAGGHGWEGRRMQVWAHVRVGSVPDALLEVARRVDASVIVVGSDGNRPWLDRVLHGSVVEPLHRQSGCSVLLARRRRPSSVPPPPVRSAPRLEDLARYDGAKTLSFPER
jgi:nucleotide-binding universal stress UspA family protein